MPSPMLSYHAERLIWKLQELLEPLGPYWMAVPILALAFLAPIIWSIIRIPET